ncbi:MAG: heavy-metal-associated domain-containing protein [Elusimicrobia bacterium]|nr:heavy-metal-associated domain-containing protein [Elusimicrobiota bacterium]
MDKKFFGLAALASAGLASICCIGPLLLTGLGLGSLGLAAGLVKYRSFFMALTGGILAVAFYRTYRTREVSCADGSCELHSGSRAMKAGLWAVTLLAAALASFPTWSARVLAGGHQSIPSGSQVLMLKVSGMDCAACTTGIKRSVEKVPGVLSADIDFSAGQATVVSDGKADPQAVIAAVAAAGYKAELLNGGSDGKPRS